MPIYAEKICDMRTLLKYVKNAAHMCIKLTCLLLLLLLLLLLNEEIKVA